jgi:hypothetical protein
MMPSFNFGRGVEKVPIGGHIMAHSSQTRLSLNKGTSFFFFIKTKDIHSQGCNKNL